VDNSDAVLDVVAVLANDAGDEGGGVYAYLSSASALTNLTLADNTAAGEGGGLYLRYASIPISNSIFSANAAAEGGSVYADGSTPTVTYCDAWLGEPDEYVGFTDPTGADGNLAVDPGFLDLGASRALDWDLHLATTSALIDAGDPAVHDPDGSTSDMGAFGGAYADLWDLDGDGYPSWWQPGSYDALLYPAEGWDCDDTDPWVFPGSGC